MKQLSKAKLAHVLQTRMKNVNKNDAVVYVELGTIGSNTILKVDSINDEIPNDEYSKLNSCGYLENGDRVLVVWASGEPVVVGKIV